jgi:hypothetical protein
MTLNKVLASTSVALGALLAIQVAIVYYQNLQPPQRRFHASWIDKADTLAEGLDKSDHVILGEVIELKKGRDIVVSAPGEPGGVDRIPTTIVKLEVQKTYKGPLRGREIVELMQTGHSTDAELLPENPFPAVHEDKGKGKGKGRSKRGVKGESKDSPGAPTAGDSRATIIEDDPPYLVGEKYVLFLKDMQYAHGSAAALAGVGPAMKRGLAPEGRFQITKGDRLKPATTRRGFAPTLIGKPLTEFEAIVPPLP